MTYKGDIEGFPTEVVEWMLDQQERQGNVRDVRVFEKERYSSKDRGGFWWDETDDLDFCVRVILDRDFDHFFTRYPKP